MSYEYLYQGSQSSLNPEYGDLFTGYRVPASEIGATTGIQTANQIGQVNALLNQGVENVEVSTVQAEVLEMIPKQHLDEIRRLAKLTGTETSLHAPVIDPSGFTQQGWSETNREIAERQFTEATRKAYKMSPDGNIPVTIHSSGLQGTEHIIDPETGEEIPQTMAIVNQETGQIGVVKREERFYPEKLRKEGKEYKGKIYPVEEEIQIHNDSEWINGITNLAFYKKESDEVMGRAHAVLQPIITEMKKGEQIDLNSLTDTQKIAFNQLKKTGLFLSNIESSFRGIFNKAYKYPAGKTKQEQEETKRKLEKISEKWREEEENAKKGKINPIEAPLRRSMLIDESIERIQQLSSPNVYVPINDFVQEKASETLGNVAFNAYKEFGNKAPIVSIENPPYGGAVSTAEDLKLLVENSRKKFVENAKKKGMSGSEAKAVAEKLIGVTWDTSHINMIRKQGFGKEKLVQQTKEIAPYVKHVHLNDNLGSTHTDLPPGMGNVPMKEILKELEKAGFKGKKVFEGGNFFQHFQKSPHPYVLEGLGVPAFSGAAGPYWNQITAGYGNYFAQPLAIFPEQHFSMYGAGFSGLPQELGGQIPGRQSRTTGTPMA